MPCIEKFGEGKGIGNPYINHNKKKNKRFVLFNNKQNIVLVVLKHFSIFIHSYLSRLTITYSN